MLKSLLQAFQQNEKHPFVQILRTFTQNPDHTSTDKKEWFTSMYATAASRSEHKKCLELLLQYGVGMFFDKDDQIGNAKKTALHMACENGCDDNVLVLLHAGCNPNIQTSKGETALHIASYKGCFKIVKYLLNYSASINARNKLGRTPLHMAAISRQLHVIQLLLEKGADLQSIDSDGCLPIHSVYDRCRYFKSARFLLEHDLTTINSQDSEGNTPLMCALAHKCGHTEFNHFWLNYGEKIKFCNERDKTTKSNKYIRFLLKNGAKTEFCNKRGRTALHLAVEAKNHEILPLLLKITDMKWMEQTLSSSIIDWKIENGVVYPRTSFIENGVVYPRTSFPPDAFMGFSVDSRLKNHFDNVEDEKEYRYFRRLIHLKSTVGSHFGSLLHYALRTLDVKTVSTLLTSELPKCILQSPIFRKQYIYSPLAFLLDNFDGAKEEEFNACLNLLLKHKITTLDDFNRVVPIKWPVYDYYSDFPDPFSIIIKNSYLRSKQRYYVNLLIENDVTADYNLQCFYDNKRPFVFSSRGNDYYSMYKTVTDTIGSSNLEMLKLMISNSVILESDILLKYFFSRDGRMHITGATYKIDIDDPKPIKGCDKTYEVYLYLISLKPLKYKKRPKCYKNYERDLWSAMRHEQPSAFKLREEFSNVTLKQLCRTFIRQHLRGPTLEDNLRNFKKNILELPLPKCLNDYLLFKN
ncbi:hypothetical protein V9T40_011416 [Parthenolecanium corni]|uniref:SOCS box domain-containing protein n=1 Tax=Parthenolecanium corni TaxID=536013 RepID=A0AAN9XZJ5_9HEMI